MKYDFIEIGTCDFATVSETVSYKSIGLAVEPLKHYLDRVPVRPKVKKVCAAITDADGSFNIHHVPSDVITNLGLPRWVKGCNRVGDPHPTLVKYLTKKGIPLDIIQNDTISTMTLKTLFIQNDVSEIGYFKVDTEGYDYGIVKQLFELIETCPALAPERIKCEHVHMNKSEQNVICGLMEAWGYEVQIKKEDIVAVLIQAS